MHAARLEGAAEGRDVHVPVEAALVQLVRRAVGGDHEPRARTAHGGDEPRDDGGVGDVGELPGQGQG